MSIWLRMAGSLITITGCLLFVLTIVNRHDLPKFMYLKTEKVEVVKEQPKEEPKDKVLQIATVGPTTVTDRWESAVGAAKGAPTGEYQFEDNIGLITLLKFCNEPPPDFKKGTKLVIQYLPAPYTKNIDGTLHRPDCVSMVAAQVVK